MPPVALVATCQLWKVTQTYTVRQKRRVLVVLGARNATRRETLALIPCAVRVNDKLEICCCRAEALKSPIAAVSPFSRLRGAATAGTTSLLPRLRSSRKDSVQGEEGVRAVPKPHPREQPARRLASKRAMRGGWMWGMRINGGEVLHLPPYSAVRSRWLRLGKEESSGVGKRVRPESERRSRRTAA